MRCTLTHVGRALAIGSMIAGLAASPLTTLPAEACEAAGTLTGRVMRQPSAPAGRPDATDAGAAAGLEVRVRKPAGDVIGVGRVGRDGTYRIELPPGTYEVTVGPLSGMAFAKGLPASVSIVRDRETRLDVIVDTGMR